MKLHPFLENRHSLLEITGVDSLHAYLFLLSFYQKYGTSLENLGEFSLMEVTFGMYYAIRNDLPKLYMEYILEFTCIIIWKMLIEYNIKYSTENKSISKYYGIFGCSPFIKSNTGN